MEFVAKNVKYPEAAMKAGKEGKVIVRFTVQADGKVADANVIRSISPELDAEAVRVVSTFPAFTPGTVDGKPVACHYVIPISFKLSKDDAAKPLHPRPRNNTSTAIITTVRVRSDQGPVSNRDTGPCIVPDAEQRLKTHSLCLLPHRPDRSSDVASRQSQQA